MREKQPGKRVNPQGFALSLAQVVCVFGAGEKKGW